MSDPQAFCLIQGWLSVFRLTLTVQIDLLNPYSSVPYAFIHSYSASAPRKGVLEVPSNIAAKKGELLMRRYCQ